MQKMEEDHRSEVKVYLQKVKHLEFDRERNNNNVETDGNEKREKEIAEHKKTTEQLQKQKIQLKNDFNKVEKDNEETVEKNKAENTIGLNYIKNTFDKKILDLKDKYEGQLKK